MDPTIPTSVIEVQDYTWILQEIERNTALTADASVQIAGYLLFLVVVVLLYFVYKFFRMFL